ncbi:MAG: hypothetical protein J6V40_02815, partial [Clostridia bacterium]|nr:hypothetical protein [Clostridia bacterium]
MSNQTNPEELVASKFSKWKLQYARLTTREKIIKLLTLATTILMLCFVTCVVLNVVEMATYDEVYATVVNSEKEYKNGKFVGYTNTYLIYHNEEYGPHISSTLVNSQYNAGTQIKVYIKEKGDTLVVTEYYKTDTALLVCTITFATLLAGSCIANLVLNNRNRIYKSKIASSVTTTNKIDIGTLE